MKEEPNLNDGPTLKYVWKLVVKQEPHQIKATKNALTIKIYDKNMIWSLL